MHRIDAQPRQLGFLAVQLILEKNGPAKLADIFVRLLRGRGHIVHRARPAISRLSGAKRIQSSVGVS